MQQWITVYAAPPWEAAWLRAELDQRGILAFSPDENLKIIDPAITGSNALNTLVQVPEDAVDAATQAIRELFASRPRQGADPRSDGEDAVWSTPRLEELERLGWRICWACFAALTAPIGWYLAARYFRLAKGLEGRPPFLGYVVAGLLYSLVLVVMGLLATVPSLGFSRF